jgi:hypothetical protein
MMFHTYKWEDATELHDALTEQLLFGTTDIIDDANSTDVQMHNVLAWADSFKWDYDISRLWTTPQRWNKMVRQYVNPEAFDSWIKAVEDLPASRRGISVFRTNLVQSRETGRGKVRRHGSCMLTLSYRERPIPQITLHSRTCYLGYLSVLDMTVANVFARWASAIRGVPVEEMAFLWQLEMAQFHGFRTIAYPLGGSDELYEEYCRLSTKDRPGLALSRKFHDKFLEMDKNGIPYGDMSFASFRRPRVRWHVQVYGQEYSQQFVGGTRNPSWAKSMKPIPATHVQDLDFIAIGRPGPDAC